MNKNPWKQLSSHTSGQMPEIVQELLTASGYDSKLSLMDLNEENIGNIEQHFTANRESLQTYLTKLKNKDKSIEYYEELAKNSQEFKFLPAHRGIILNIPGMIEEITKNKQDKMKPGAKPGNPSTADEEAKKREAKKRAQDEVRKKMNDLGCEYVKDLLVKKVKKEVEELAKTNKSLQQLPSVIDISQVKTFDEIHDKMHIYEAKYGCPNCNSKITAVFVNRWKTWNIKRHLESHFKSKLKPKSKIL